MTTISSVQTSQVYIMYSEIPHLHDKMNIKIGISVDPEDRRKGLQTSNPFPIHIIKTFNAGIEALKHEKHFHDLYEKYNTSGEWFLVDSNYFEDVILPEMIEYFNNITVIEGEVKKTISTTNLQLDELLEGTDVVLSNIISSKYVDKKIAIVKLEKAKTLVDDNKKKDYQSRIDFIQSVINHERDELRKLSQEKLAVKVLKRQANVAKRKLQQFAMGYMVALT
tara:strand:- start:47 stop:715 length:669 start_codon:yes stop_codon:yes gene_type:complete